MKDLPKLWIKCEDGRQAFTAGERLRGSVFLTLQQPTKMKNLKLQFYGEAYCRFDKTEEAKSRKRKTKEEIANLVKVLFSSDSDLTPDSPPTLSSGSHCYDFEFSLPKYLSCSFERPKERNNGLEYIRYNLIATITRPGSSDHVKELPVIINEVLDISHPQFSFSPCSQTEKQVGWLPPYGTLKIFARLDRCCYSQGDTVFITAIAENDTSRVMNSIYRKLFRRTYYRIKGDKRTYSECIDQYFGPRILSRETVRWENQPLKLPLNAGPTITQNSKIRVEYVLQIGFYESFVDEVHIDLPLAIGTTSSYLEEKRRTEAERSEISVKKGKE